MAASKFHMSKNFPSQENFKTPSPVADEATAPAGSYSAEVITASCDSHAGFLNSMHSSGQIVHNYEEKVDFKSFEQLSEDKSVTSSIYSVNCSQICHSRSFEPDCLLWSPNEDYTHSQERTTPSQDPNCPNSGQITPFMNRSCSENVVKSSESYSTLESRVAMNSIPFIDGYPGTEDPGQSTPENGPASFVHIGTLSDEVLSQIFIFCPWKELLCVLSLVCRRWRTIIENDPYLCRFQNVTINISASNLGQSISFHSNTFSLSNLEN